MKYPVVNKLIRQQMIDYHKNIAANWESIDPGCGNCEHFGGNGAKCHKFDATVPDDVIPQGCDSWQHDPIPF